MESVAGAVATGSGDGVSTGSGSDRVAVIARIEIAGVVTRSHPPPHAGCPRGDPGPLPVLTSFAKADSRRRHSRRMRCSQHEGSSPMKTKLLLLFVILVASISASAQCERAPQRIVFARGATVARARGYLRGMRDSAWFVLHAGAGQYMRININAP